MIGEARLKRRAKREKSRVMEKQRQKAAHHAHAAYKEIALQNFHCDCVFCCYRVHMIQTKVFDPGPQFEAPKTCKNYPKYDSFLCIECPRDSDELGGRCVGCQSREDARLNAKCAKCGERREELKNAECYACMQKAKDELWGVPDPTKLVRLT